MPIINYEYYVWGVPESHLKSADELFTLAKANIERDYPDVEVDDRALLDAVNEVTAVQIVEGGEPLVVPAEQGVTSAFQVDSHDLPTPVIGSGSDGEQPRIALSSSSETGRKLTASDENATATGARTIGRRRMVDSERLEEKIVRLTELIKNGKLPSERLAAMKWKLAQAKSRRRNEKYRARQQRGPVALSLQGIMGRVLGDERRAFVCQCSTFKCTNTACMCK